MIERFRVQIPAGAAVGVSPPELALYSNSYLVSVPPPKEGRGYPMSPPSGISGLSLDSTLLSPLFFFFYSFIFFICLFLLLFLSYVVVFSAYWSILLNFFPENSSILFDKR